MRVARSRSHVRLLCCLLSYTLILTLLVPPARMAETLAVSSRGIHKISNSTATKKAQADAPRRAGELIVRFREDVSDQGKNQIASSKGARRKGKLRGDSRAEKLELQPGQDAAAVAEQLRQRPEIELAEPNFLVTRDNVSPNDIRFPEQWALRNTGQSGGSVGSDIRATAASSLVCRGYSRGSLTRTAAGGPTTWSRHPAVA